MADKYDQYPAYMRDYLKWLDDMMTTFLIVFVVCMGMIAFLVSLPTDKVAPPKCNCESTK